MSPIVSRARMVSPIASRRMISIDLDITTEMLEEELLLELERTILAAVERAGIGRVRSIEALPHEFEADQLAAAEAGEAMSEADRWTPRLLPNTDSAWTPIRAGQEG